MCLHGGRVSSRWTCVLSDDEMVIHLHPNLQTDPSCFTPPPPLWGLFCHLWLKGRRGRRPFDLQPHVGLLLPILGDSSDGVTVQAELPSPLHKCKSRRTFIVFNLLPSEVKLEIRTFPNQPVWA